MKRFLGDLILQVMSFTAEIERQNIKQRQAEGIAEARKAGVRLGRKPKPLPDNFNEVAHLLDEKAITMTKAAFLTGMPRTTFRDHWKEWKNDHASDV